MRPAAALCRASEAFANVPMSMPLLSERERAYALQALDANEFGPSGPFRSRFESAWARRNGVAHAVTLSSGTAALHVGLMALGIGAGDEVIVPAMTYVASANAVLHSGARPVFVDVDPETWCIDPDAVASAITPRTRAIMPVHLFGHPCPMDALRSMSQSRGIALVADGAHAPLAGYRGRSVTAAATLTAHSFFLNKTFTCGEGGALLTDDPALAAAATQLRAHGLDGVAPFYRRLGYNFRLSNLACALLCGQEEAADAILDRCATLDTLYRERIRDLPSVRPQTIREWAQPVQWMFPVVLPREAPPREVVIGRLLDRGIGARSFFPVPSAIDHLAPFVGDRRHCLAVADDLSRRGLLLPLRATMADEDVDRVISGLAAALA